MELSLQAGWFHTMIICADKHNPSVTQQYYIV